MSSSSVTLSCTISGLGCVWSQPKHLRLFPTASRWLAHTVLLLPALWFCSVLPGGHQLFHLPTEDQGLPGPAGQYQQSALVNYPLCDCFVTVWQTVFSSHQLRCQLWEMNTCDFLKKCVASAGLPLQGQPALYGLQLPAAVCVDLLCFPHHP